MVYPWWEYKTHLEQTQGCLKGMLVVRCQARNTLGRSLLPWAHRSPRRSSPPGKTLQQKIRNYNLFEPLHFRLKSHGKKWHRKTNPSNISCHDVPHAGFGLTLCEDWSYLHSLLRLIFHDDLSRVFELHTAWLPRVQPSFDELAAAWEKIMSTQNLALIIWHAKIRYLPGCLQPLRKPRLKWPWPQQSGPGRSTVPQRQVVWRGFVEHKMNKIACLSSHV